MKKQKEKKIKKRLNRNGEVIKNNNYGITLMALVITIIVLLILAGISIGMISGDNSIIGQAGNAKKQTDIAGEKEILQTSTLSAMGKSKYGDLTKDKLDDELNKYQEIESSEQIDDGIVVTFKSNRQYLVNFDGDVSSYSDIKIGNLVVKDGNNILAENCKSVQLGKSLTINFEASIENGQITSITPNIAYTTAGERKKVFTIIGKTPEGKEITKQYMVNLSGYYNIPNIKVGDFVNYALKTPTSAELAQLNSDIATYSGATDNTTKTASEDTLLCRVLEIDTEGNPTKLISSDGVNSLKLKGANGYNNAVYLINEMCESLYSGNQGTTTSLKIEDLENSYFSDLAIEERNESTSIYPSVAVKYGKQKRYTGSNSKYPLLATKEKRMGINTTTETLEGNIFNILNTSNTALDLSEQEEEDLNSGGITTSSVANGITVTQTSYKIFAGMTDYKSKALYSIMHKKSSSGETSESNVTSYWLSSRCVTTYSGYNECYFCIFCINSSVLDRDAMCESSGGENYSKTYAIRPVITLNPGIQAEYVEAYNNTYNTWNLE